MDIGGKEGKKGGKTSLPNQQEERLLPPRTSLKPLRRLQVLPDAPPPPPPCRSSPQGAPASSHAGPPSCAPTGATHLSPQGLCTAAALVWTPSSPHPSGVPFQPYFASFRTVCRPRERLSALGGHIPVPQHPLPLLQTPIRSVIPSSFVLAPVCPAGWSAAPIGQGPRSSFLCCLCPHATAGAL